MGDKQLSIALERYDRHVPIFMGSVPPPAGVQLRPLEVGMQTHHRDGRDRHRRFLQDREFDIAETSLSSHIISVSGAGPCPSLAPRYRLQSRYSGYRPNHHSNPDAAADRRRRRALRHCRQPLQTPPWPAISQTISPRSLPLFLADTKFTLCDQGHAAQFGLNALDNGHGLGYGTP